MFLVTSTEIPLFVLSLFRVFILDVPTVKNTTQVCLNDISAMKIIFQEGCISLVYEI